MPPTLREVSETLSEHLIECAEGNRKTAEILAKLVDGHEAIGHLIQNFQAVAWKAFLSLVGVMATAASTLLVQNYLTTRKAEAPHYQPVAAHAAPHADPSAPTRR